MEKNTDQLWFIRSVLDDLPWWMNGADAVRLIVRESDDTIMLYDADQYIWAYTRSQGYYIPSYPMDPAGEIREFFADEGVHDVPGWYKTIGVDERAYAHISDYHLLVVKDAAFRRQITLLPSQAFDYFATIPAQMDAELLRTARFALDFVLGRTAERA